MSSNTIFGGCLALAVITAILPPVRPVVEAVKEGVRYAEPLPDVGQAQVVVPCDAEASQMKPVPEPENDEPLPIGITWVTEKEARASGKPIWYHVTLDQGCAPCLRAEKLLAAPPVIAASQDFACVRIIKPLIPPGFKTQAEQLAYNEKWGKWLRHYGVTVMPSDRFVAPDLKKFTGHTGCPQNIAHLLTILVDAKAFCEGKPMPMQAGRGDDKPIPNTHIKTPDLADDPAPPLSHEAPGVVAGPEGSVLVKPKSASPLGNACGPQGCGRRVSSPGWFNRMRIAPQRGGLFR